MYIISINKTNQKPKDTKMDEVAMIETELTVKYGIGIGDCTDIDSVLNDLKAGLSVNDIVENIGQKNDLVDMTVTHW